MVKKDNLKLGKQDWIECGLEVLADRGVEAIKVEPLAKLLNVTKGSFYWHFKNREKLLDAILQEWVRVETNGIIDRVEELGGDAKKKLLNLFEIASEDDGKVENAIRAWATKDSKVANILDRIDKKRLEYTRDLFLQIGFTPTEAIVRAQMAYYALVGEFTIGIRGDRTKRLAEVRLEYEILTRQD
ncbi:MAG: TetR/AcrR family transcriptional regulator [Xenococcaceae cyanobacterium]